jgi:hypothetical protein
MTQFYVILSVSMTTVFNVFSARPKEAAGKKDEMELLQGQCSSLTSKLQCWQRSYHIPARKRKAML